MTSLELGGSIPFELEHLLALVIGKRHQLFDQLHYGPWSNVIFIVFHPLSFILYKIVPLLITYFAF